MSEITDQILVMSKAQSIADKTIVLLTREKQVLQESLLEADQQLSKQTTSMTVAATMYQESLGNLRFNINELEEQVSSKQDSLGLLKVSNTQLTTQVDVLSTQVVDLEARNSKLLSEKQELLTRFHQLEEKKRGDLKTNKAKMEILEDIMMRRNKR